MNPPLLIYPFTRGKTSGFSQLLSIIHKVSMNIQRPVLEKLFHISFPFV